MSINQITFHEVNLHYASLGFKERSLKSVISQVVKLKKDKIEIKSIHALKNISLTIKQGERIGLLGHNGAGKSTFLKAIAGLYPISSGNLKVVGSVRALFDLSLGFEPDATGKENILYRGLLLGLSPKFIHQKKQEIIDFADLGEFIHYPVKTYSAGMQVRLAFAISTIMGGDILLLDEIIGAGDANFMSKAQKRILELVEQSKILILASHDLTSLKNMCTRGLVFNKGHLVFDGKIDKSVQEYNKINGLNCYV